VLESGHLEDQERERIETDASEIFMGKGVAGTGSRSLSNDGSGVRIILTDQVKYHFKIFHCALTKHHAMKAYWGNGGRAPVIL
jgi:hypothetical protein